MVSPRDAGSAPKSPVVRARFLKFYQEWEMIVEHSRILMIVHTSGLCGLLCSFLVSPLEIDVLRKLLFLPKHK